MAFSVPGLLNIEAPVKLKIFVVVVVHESTGGFVMATVDHAGGCFFFVNCVVDIVSILLVFLYSHPSITTLQMGRNIQVFS